MLALPSRDQSLFLGGTAISGHFTLRARGLLYCSVSALPRKRIFTGTSGMSAFVPELQITMSEASVKVY